MKFDRILKMRSAHVCSSAGRQSTRSLYVVCESKLTLMMHVYLSQAFVSRNESLCWVPEKRRKIARPEFQEVCLQLAAYVISSVKQHGFVVLF